MKKSLLFALILSIALPLLTTSCKSEFEKIRASGDTALLYKKAEEYYAAEEYQKAQTLYELIIGAYRGKKELEDIYLKYSYTYYHLERFILASYYFDNFSNTFPNSKYREESDYMVAYSNYEMSPNYKLDQTYTQKAIDEFQLFVNTYPQSDKVAKCNDLIDNMRLKMEVKAFETGNLYKDLRQYQAAMQSYENVLRDYPETTNTEAIRYNMVLVSSNLAANSVFEKRLKRYEEAKQHAVNFMAKFKSSKNYNEVETIYNNINKEINKLKDGRYQEQSARAGS